MLSGEYWCSFSFFTCYAFYLVAAFKIFSLYVIFINLNLIYLDDFFLFTYLFDIYILLFLSPVCLTLASWIFDLFYFIKFGSSQPSSVEIFILTHSLSLSLLLPSPLELLICWCMMSTFCNRTFNILILIILNSLTDVPSSGHISSLV